MDTTLNEFINSIYFFNNYSEISYKNAERIISDTVASVLYGIRDQEVQDLINTKNVETNNSFQMLGSSATLNKMDAVLVYGISAVSNELDEGNTAAKGHPGSQIIPAILTTNNNYKTKDVLIAFIKSYEISSRIARAIDLDKNTHPHGSWGIVGYVAFKCLLNKNFNENDLLNCVRLALSLPISTSWFSAESGLTVRNAYSGLSAVVGENILDLHSSGFTTSMQVIEDVYSYKLGNSIDFDTLLQDDLATPMVDKNYFKLYPSCRFTHGAIDATERLMKEKIIDTNSIDTITIETYDLASRCNTTTPTSQLEAKFSIPYCIAITLLGLDPLNYYKNNLPIIRTLINKIKVIERKEFTNLLPDYRVTEVNITTITGEELQSRVDVAKGEYTNPVSKEELINKYKKLFNSRNIETDIDHLINIRKHKYFMDWLNVL